MDKFKGYVNNSQPSRVMEGSSEEEEGEEEREKLRCVAVTSEDLFSSHEAKKSPRGRQATSNDVLARRLHQWVER